MSDEQFILSCDALIAAGKVRDKRPVKELVEAYYLRPNFGAGGSLHIVLDDGNIGDDSIKFCIDYARKAGDLLGEKLGEVLLLCSRTQRSSL